MHNTSKFDGKSSSELLQYLEDIDFIGDAVGLNNAKKIKAVLHYTALDEAEVWQMLPELTANLVNWDEFMKVVKKMYVGCEGTDWYYHANIQYLV